MPTIIEKDSPIMPLILCAVIFLVILGSVLELAYIGGVFTGKNEVIANDKRIANLALPISAPSTAPETAKH